MQSSRRRRDVFKITLAFSPICYYIGRVIKMQEGFMEISAKKEQKGLVVSVAGRMDAVSSPDFEKELDAWLEKGETLIVVDCGNLEYISSSGLRSVLTIAKKMKARNGKILLAALTSVVKEVFEISGFSAIIPVYDSLQDAVADL